MALSFTESLDTLYTTTWQLRRKEIVDQIMTATPFWYLMTKKGKRRTESGGRWIEVPLQYAKNETVQFFGKGDTISINDTQPLTVARWDWKYLAGSIVRYFVDDQKNRGQAAVINLMNAKLDNLRMSLIDKLETSLFGDGTGDSSKAIDGLGNIIAETTTSGTVAGIDRASYTWWRNNATNQTGKSSSVYLRSAMSTMFNNCGKQGEGVTRFPDVIVTTQTIYEYYESETVEIARILIGDKQLADLGFGELAYKGRPITWSPAQTADNMYFINTNFLEFVADPIANFDMTDWKPIIDQPNDRIAQIVSVGNLVCSNCQRQGVLYNIDTA